MIDQDTLGGLVSSSPIARNLSNCPIRALNQEGAGKPILAVARRTRAELLDLRARDRLRRRASVVPAAPASRVDTVRLVGARAGCDQPDCDLAQI